MIPFVWAALLALVSFVWNVYGVSSPLALTLVTSVALIHWFSTRKLRLVSWARFYFVGGFIALSALCLGNAALADSRDYPPAIQTLANQYSEQIVEFRVTDVSRTSVTVHAKIEGMPDFSARIYAGRDAEPKLSLGQTYRANFRVKPSGRDSPRVSLTPLSTPLLLDSKPSPIETLKLNFARSARAVTPDSGALVAGLAIGDDSALSLSMSERMKSLSLTHLTAVSGANCAIVIGGVFFLLRSLGARRSFVVAASVSALCLYVAVVGTEPSVLRAALMAAVVLVFMISGRKVPALVALAWAMTLTLVLWSKMVTSLGFWLSVSATAAILVLAPKLYQVLKLRTPAWLAMSLAVVVSAQLWCMPLLLDLQGGLPTYSVVANLLAEPLVAPITILGILALMLASVFPGVGSFLFWLASTFAWVIEQISQLALLPVASIWWPSGLVGLLLMITSVLALTLLIIKRHRKLALAGLAAVALSFLSFSGSAVARSTNWPTPNWEVASCDVGQGDATVIRNAGRVMLIDVGREPDLINECLKKLEAKHIDLLLLTHFDADHVAGLAGVFEQASVGQAMVSPFRDERPLVALTMQMLETQGVRVSTAEVGDRGQLGGALWQVVAPEPNARGAEDSNDASVILRVETSGWLLLTFADAGERAQMRTVRLRNALLNRTLNKPLIVKVSHHGSADQYPELFEDLRPELALFSVGASNGYGHPTSRTIDLFTRAGSKILRTDQQGSIVISLNEGRLTSLSER